MNKDAMVYVRHFLFLIFLVSAVICLYSNCYAVSAETFKSEIIAKAKLDLMKAIKIASNKIPGQPIEAHLDTQSPSPVYVVTILKNMPTEIVVVSIDGITGNIMTVVPLPAETVPSFAPAPSQSPVAPVTADKPKQ